MCVKVPDYNCPLTIPELPPCGRLAEPCCSLLSCCRCQATLGQCKHSAADGQPCGVASCSKTVL